MEGHGTSTAILSAVVALFFVSGVSAEHATATECKAESCLMMAGLKSDTEDPMSVPESVPHSVPPQEISLEELIQAVQTNTGDEGHQAVTDLWYYAADHGVPGAALDALEGAAQNPDPVISQQAERALQDLHHLQGL